MNDAERKAWIENDEGLLSMQRASGKSMTKFIKDNRAELDRLIGLVTSGKKRAHFLIYG